MRTGWIVLLLCVVLIPVTPACRKKKTDTDPGVLHLAWVKVNGIYLNPAQTVSDIPVDSALWISFNEALDPASIPAGIILTGSNGIPVACTFTMADNNHLAILRTGEPMSYNVTHTISLTAMLKGAGGETFPGAQYTFKTINGTFELVSASLNGQPFGIPSIPRNIDREHVSIVVKFSQPVDTTGVGSCFTLSSGIPAVSSVSPDHRTITITNGSTLPSVTRLYFSVSSGLKAENGFTFKGFVNSFYSEIDSSNKFPPLSDEELLDLIQLKGFRYFYDFGHPASGMARERNSSGDIVTSGGSGFGIMTLIVGMHRQFITRTEGLDRLSRMLTFLETCDRFHGAWPHWLNGVTGKTVPFSTKDNGGDLVETSYMVQGLLTMRQFLDPGSNAEKGLIDRINLLVDAVEYDWYTRGEQVLYWHWSPDYGWAMNMQVRGYNETLITYITAATSRLHGIEPAVYHQGYARNGAIKNGQSYYDIVLPLGEPYGGPLFFTHYSFLGLDPRNLNDAYANYWQQNTNQSMINYRYCLDNPHNYIGYSTDVWGLTASDNPDGYSAHSPLNDLGVITPTAALSAMPYTPEQSMKAARFFYHVLGDKSWGEYGFYDAFDMTRCWWATSTLAIDQGPMVCMIENARSGLLWNLFMSCPEVKSGLTALGFSYSSQK